MPIYFHRKWEFFGWHFDVQDWNFMKHPGQGRIGYGLLVYTYSYGFDIILSIQPREFILGYTKKGQKPCR